MASGSVDIIIPTRNRFELTFEAICSVQNQTFRDWTLYVVDDASDDGSRNRLHAATAADPRVMIVQRPARGGPAAARQTGFLEGSAPYVATLDSDDLWKPAKLEGQIELLRGWEATHPEVVGLFSLHTWTHYTQQRRSHLAQEAGHTQLVRNPLCTSNMSTPLLRRAKLEEVGGFLPPDGRNLRSAEGIEFFVRLTSLGPLVHHGDILAECRTHAGERTSNQHASAGGAADLEYVLSLHNDWLARWPADLAALHARLGLRLVYLGRSKEGLSHLHRAWSYAPPSKKLSLVRRYGPRIAKALVAAGVRSRER
jgi:glycosyltransferase involved in cell wall biosynthesis